MKGKIIVVFGGAIILIVLLLLYININWKIHFRPDLPQKIVVFPREVYNLSYKEPLQRIRLGKEDILDFMLVGDYCINVFGNQKEGIKWYKKGYQRYLDSFYIFNLIELYVQIGDYAKASRYYRRISIYSKESISREV